MVVFLTNFIMLGIGILLNRKQQNPYFPLLLTGFETGMLGFSLFATVYGASNINILGIVDLGQELYVWFVLVTMLYSLKDRAGSIKKVCGSFITSPVIIAILSGLLLNFLGLRSFLIENPIISGLLNTLNMVSQLSIPLILMVIGYQLNFRLGQLRFPLKTILWRMPILLILAFIINELVLKNWLGLELIFRTALLVLFILPPPFIIPLFMSNNKEGEVTYVNNTLSLGTLFTIVIFIIAAFFYQ